MLANAKIKLVNDLVADLSRDEIIWLNGYLTGLLERPPQTPPVEGLSATQHSLAGEPNEKIESSKSVVSAVALLPTGEAGGAVGRITLAYGTETGNAKRLATSLAGKAKKSGVQVKLVSLDQYKPTDLVKEEYFFVVISTQGEGEPPVGAKKFYDALFTENLSFPKLNYTVLGLGDTAYPLFCKTGEDVDAQLQKLGGNRLLPLQKCDVDYEEDANRWFEKALASLQTTNASKETPTRPSPLAPPAPKTKGKKYYEGRILTNINLNGRGSKKQTFHIEIGVNEAVDYEPGDSLAIVPQNRKAVVNEIIRLTGVDKDFVLTTDKHSGTIEQLLTKDLNVCYLLTSTIKAYAEITQQQIPDTRMDLKDLLRIYPVKDAVQGLEVIKLLKPIAPRLYSISSSPLAHPGEIHLTVGKHAFLLQDEQHFGLCSEFMGELATGSVLKFYIHKNRAFKLPAADKDIIMVGPGIGIAPYRSFIAERDAQGAAGRSWLFFGDQHFTTDFLYQTEWQSYLATGSLTKMNVAFSQDGEEKIYVEHKMKQHAEELFQWIEGGAHVYVCGEKGPLHEKVENELKQIIKDGKNISDDEAATYFAEMKKNGRYEREVF